MLERMAAHPGWPLLRAGTPGGAARPAGSSEPTPHPVAAALWPVHHSPGLTGTGCAVSSCCACHRTLAPSGRVAVVVEPTGKRCRCSAGAQGTTKDLQGWLHAPACRRPHQLWGLSPGRSAPARWPCDACGLASPAAPARLLALGPACFVCRGLAKSSRVALSSCFLECATRPQSAWSAGPTRRTQGGEASLHGQRAERLSFSVPLHPHCVVGVPLELLHLSVPRKGREPQRSGAAAHMKESSAKQQGLSAPLLPPAQDKAPQQGALGPFGQLGSLGLPDKVAVGWPATLAWSG